MNFINQKSNKKKVLNFVLRSNGSLRVKNALKPFSKYLKEGIGKIKQYLKYILMIINQKISMKNFIPQKQLPKLPLLNSLAKFLIERKYLMSSFTFLRVNSLDEATKSINSLKQIINLQVIMAEQQNFMNIFQIN